MSRKYVYFVFGFTFVSLLLILFSYMGHHSELQATQKIEVENPPFFTYVSGSGIVEPSSGTILITPSFTRTVEKINVKVNDHVKQGETLFQLYNKDLKAKVRVKKREYQIALARMNKLESVPREEDCIIAQENLHKAEALFNQAKARYCMANSIFCNKYADSLRLNQYRQAEAEFLATKAESQKILSGTWLPDLQIAKEEIALAKAEIEAMEAELERTFITSPLDGTVLQIKIREGELVDQSKYAMIVGTINELNLRVSIDQFNEGRFHQNCPAVAFKQGDTTIEFPITFLHVEPLMVPKKYLTNELLEKVDSQVFEVLYRINKPHSSLFIGEQMDVYIYVEKKEN